MLPSNYDGDTRSRLWCRFTDSKARQSCIDYWTQNGQVDAKRFIGGPDGSKDGKGRAFWNASSACCNKEGRDVDDSATSGA